MSLRMVILLIVALVSVSLSSIFARYLPDVPAVVIAFWRMTTAGCLLWGFSAVKPQGAISRINAQKTVLAGIFLGLHFAFFFGALKLTSVANATILATMAPVFTALIERFGLKRSWNRDVLTGLIIAVLGAMLIQGFELNFPQGNRLGNLLALLSSLWMAIVLLTAEQIRRETATIIYSRLVYTVAGITLLLVAVAFSAPVFAFSARDFTWLFLLGLIPTVVGHTSFSYAVKYVRPTIVASVPLGEPVIASALAWFLFREPLTVNVVLGGALVLTGLYRITKRQSVSDFQNDNL
ncbi:MAG: DMT family transporter [FCB group bacterium]|nr:DMT family transporter [FCB group bacterium]